MSICWDEEESKDTHLAEQNGFDPTVLHAEATKRQGKACLIPDVE
jgi:hypothetical protein